mmetsp:Transcript_22016/g.66144  ORF Transcript_22016/g.66144 Transcript_22016/m.66144 type:complete len:265 (+) Transcript_22016:506-1300(+)
MPGLLCLASVLCRPAAAQPRGFRYLRWSASSSTLGLVLGPPRMSSGLVLVPPCWSLEDDVDVDMSLELLLCPQTLDLMEFLVLSHSLSPSRLVASESEPTCVLSMLSLRSVTLISLERRNDARTVPGLVLTLLPKGEASKGAASNVTSSPLLATAAWPSPHAENGAVGQATFAWLELCLALNMPGVDGLQADAAILLGDLKARPGGEVGATGCIGVDSASDGEIGVVGRWGGVTSGSRGASTPAIAASPQPGAWSSRVQPGGRP